MRIKVHKATVLNLLLTQEDTDHDNKITIDDQGPRKFKLIATTGREHIVEGTYYLANLLQEIALEKPDDKGEIYIYLNNVYKKPSDRISKMISTHYWNKLTRRLDNNGLEKIIKDEKTIVSEQRLYIPFADIEAQKYYNKICENRKDISIVILPEKITPEYVLSINDKPGILALSFDNKKNEAAPFVVPGGRFNEMYGWDSYFINVGLLLDSKKDLAKGMIDNFNYQITHYGKILNANRSYFLTRTQPPFYTSMILEYYEKYQDETPIAWLKDCVKIAIQEYETVWMQPEQRLANNGLNRFYAEGIGIPPETEQGHFDYILQEYAMNSNLSVHQYGKKYLNRETINLELDEYFLHDRSVRESGHDTTYRLEGICANITSVDLNSLLFKYEKDLAYCIKKYFKNEFLYNKRKYNSEYWDNKAQERVVKMNSYLWDEKKGSYFDYDIKNKKQIDFDSATSLYPLWAKLCSKEQAEKLVESLLPVIKCSYGISGSSKFSLRNVPKDAPKRQWDYPYGWAPHQMLIWKGLLNYGYDDLAQELIYRWLWMITKNAVDFNGVIPEKYDVDKGSYKIDVEYGNVGSDFKYVPDGGFGWMNASYQLGLSFLSEKLRNELDKLIEPDDIFNRKTK
ncbi:trehalase family glycosidase [Aquimarina sp. 2201CG14-23]|uniref:trehalase family glycosidase n=1 Tax=Aquimarina mycalae TaxID=3040073 RepID=UPI002477E4C0|nr:trehalase family glycosidase [Aquimarina sp. 2201CG14-23]MDH7445372.1 trehalase family glycosidase [Aquimarina sp. 2201CG14-23]